MKRTNFLNTVSTASFRMVVLILLVGSGVITGCGRKAVPVSSEIKENHRKDSITTRVTERKDSFNRVERVTEKTLPGSSVDLTTTLAQLDSIKRALQGMPANVSRTIYWTDPKMQTTLAIVLDSLGALHFKCTTAEKKYFEKSVEQSQFISEVQKENTKLVEENEVLKSQLVEYQKPFYERIFGGFATLKLVIAFILIVVLYGLFIEVKKRFWP